MSQLRHPVSTCATRAAQWKMWLFKVFSVIYAVAVCASEDNDATTYSYRESESTAPPPFEPLVPVLERTSSWSDVFSSEKVVLECKATSSSELIFTWKKNGSPLGSGPNLSPSPDKSVLTITATSPQDSGYYTCVVEGKKKPSQTKESGPVEIKVYDPPTPDLQLQTAWKDVFEGEAVEFHCRVVSSTPGWTFTWHRNKQQLQNNPVEIINGDGSSLKITSVRQTHEGSYTCKAHLTSRGVNSGFSSEVMIQVSAEKPTLTLTRDPEYDVMFAGEAVTFSCAISVQSEWTYLWYKDGSKVTGSSDKLEVQIRGTADQGSYTCKATRGQNPAFITDPSGAKQLKVQAEKPTLTLTRDPEYDVMFAGEAVTFSCAISVQSEWTYLWYKDGSKVTGSSDRLKVQISGTGDQGSYTCKATRGQNPAFITDLSAAKQLKVQKNKPKPTITQQPDAEKLYVGENVSFECKVENSDGWSYDWYKDEESIPNNSNSLKMEGLALLNGGVYKCKAKRDKTGFNTEFSDQRTVQISEIPVPTLKLVTKWPDVFPTESVNMICKMQTDSADWTYAFYRDGTEVQHYNSDKDRNLSITSASTSDGGNYSCSGKLKSRDVYSTKGSPLNLHVYAEKPTLTLTQQDPDYDVMFAGEAVTFSCAISVQSEWTYLWYKDGSKVTGSSDKLEVQISGTADQGSYTCKATRGQNPAFITDPSGAKQLKVQDAPTVTLEQNPAHNLMHSEDSVSFNCHVNVSSGWTYRFVLPDGSELDLSVSNYNITSVATKDSGLYKCKVKRGTERSSIQATVTK
ncbi:basement membrane-specific heparan sulfate proteoglycan core protein-like isoform X2 [Simochromis diagramma]|uniref:basement membrane-specific heparan sulfate proteoglycan core protein-like isoform X2 n=1 Tax=Simochromis diagramma TaxID=43689 RepID=UPI001A7EE5BB|nr:basement membrane-specific heparan sulfate proteoglycan core protein-like isoform X2 [Simochromis diagramma]